MRICKSDIYSAAASWLQQRRLFWMSRRIGFNVVVMSSDDGNCPCAERAGPRSVRRTIRTDASAAVRVDVVIRD
jgi:hypothetical protein